MKKEIVDLIKSLPAGVLTGQALSRAEDLKRRTDVIPKGDYCYEMVNGEKIVCPYWGTTEILETYKNGYCGYLRSSDRDIADGSSMLWDEVKECRENPEDYEALAAEAVASARRLVEDYLPSAEVAALYERALNQGKIVFSVVLGLAGLGMTGTAVYVGLRIAKRLRKK